MCEKDYAHRNSILPRPVCTVVSRSAASHLLHTSKTTRYEHTPCSSLPTCIRPPQTDNITDRIPQRLSTYQPTNHTNCKFPATKTSTPTKNGKCRMATGGWKNHFGWLLHLSESRRVPANPSKAALTRYGVKQPLLIPTLLPMCVV